MNRYRILLNIDALMDTRLATLERYWPDVAQQVEGDLDSWQKRSSDDMSVFGIDRDEFKAKYRSRDMETLKLARVTYLPETLADLKSQYEDNLQSIPTPEIFSIDLNTWPYKDLPNEAIYLYMEYIHEIFDQKCEVNHVYKPLNETNLAYLTGNYSCFMLHDFIEWIGTITSAKEEDVRGRTDIVHPLLMYKELNETELAKVNTLPPAIGFAMFFAPYFNVKASAVRLFSAQTLV